MRLSNGARARFTLTDGTTLEGTVRRHWWPNAWLLGKVQVLTQQGVTPAVGRFLLPKRAVVFVQVLPDEEREG